MARPLPPKIVTIVDSAVVVALTLGGLVARQGWRTWYFALFEGFAIISVPVLAAAGVTTWISERRSARIQGPRRGAMFVLRGMRDTALAAWIAACLLAWPLAKMRAGEPTGLVLTVAEAGGPVALVLGNFAGVLVLDAWLYWKHRLLHTRLLFGFHRGHHFYRDPTAFAGFAVGPVESLLTFWPVVLVGFPQTPHYAPVYFGLVIGFVMLNMYLHCGIVWPALERVLRPFSVNTSSHHNRHHANAEVHFGEALTLWDRLLKTEESARSAVTARGR